MMKKSFIRMLALTAFVFAVSSCNSDNGHKEVSKYITVNTSIGSLTRVTTDGNNIQSFTTGDQISVYAWASNTDVVNTTDLVVNNSINTYDGTTWTAAPQMLWKDMTSAHDFASTFPARSITNLSAESITLTDNIVTNDVLVATTTNRNAQQGNVPLLFDHIMGKVVVKLTFRNEFDGIPTVTGVDISAKQGATINFLTKKATANGDISKVNFTATTANTTYAAIIVPQTIKAINIVIADKTYTYTHPSDISIENGKIQNISLIVGRDRIELGSISINEWGTTTDIEGGEAVN